MNTYNWPFSDITPNDIARFASKGRWDLIKKAIRLASKRQAIGEIDFLERSKRNFVESGIPEEYLELDYKNKILKVYNFVPSDPNAALLHKIYLSGMNEGLPAKWVPPDMFIIYPKGETIIDYQGMN